MADVEIAVQAEGVEDAVGEVPPGEAPAGGEEGALAGGGGGGRLGKLLGLVATLLTFGEDIAKVVGVISSLLRAFLAPVAVMLLRLLQPLLRAMIKVLPVWYDIMSVISRVAENTGLLSRMFGLVGLLVSGVAGASLTELVGMLVSGITGKFKFSDILTAIKNIPSRLSNLLSNLPGVGGFFGGGGGGGSGDDGEGIVERGRETVINLIGSTAAVLEDVERNSGLETP